MYAYYLCTLINVMYTTQLSLSSYVATGYKDGYNDDDDGDVDDDSFQEAVTTSEPYI